jgi:hypothetical protein
MIDKRLALPMAAIGLVLVEGLAVWLALVAPDKLRIALVAGLALPALWGSAELFKGDKTHPRFAIAIAAVLLAVPLGAHLARASGWIVVDNGDLMSRLYGIASGLILAAYGNFIPRQLDRYDPAKADPARWQRLKRRAAWAFVLAGLACSIIWALLPVRVAAIWSIVPIGLSVILVLPMIIACVRGRGRKA